MTIHAPGTASARSDAVSTGPIVIGLEAEPLPDVLGVGARELPRIRPLVLRRVDDPNLRTAGRVHGGDPATQRPCSDDCNGVAR
jgi:hypothetical protein